MPSPAKGPRLWLQPARYANGKLVEHPVWCIRDGSTKRSTGLGEGADREALDKALNDYLTAKRKLPRERDRSPAEVWIADVIAIYAEDVVPNQARPKEALARIRRLLDFFGEMRLSALNRKLSEKYVASRGHVAAARRELEDLRAAARHHWKEGYCIAQTPVVLPSRGEPRETWLKRGEVARLVLAALRYHEIQKGQPTGRRSLLHIARFVLVGVYTGTRAGAICAAALEPTPGKGWVDLDAGVFYRRAAGKAETKKRQTPVPIPEELLRHLRRWRRLGISKKFVVEFNGRPVAKINKAFRHARALAGLGPEVVPHTLRHTCGTWLAQKRVPIHEICGFLGMTREIFERVYGHHHPDFLAAAVNAFSKAPRQLPDSMRATETEQERTNVVGLHGNR